MAVTVRHLGGGAFEEGAIRIEGARELQRKLADLPRKVENACLRKALRSTAGQIAKRWRAATPNRTGLARRSLKVKVRVAGSAQFGFGSSTSVTRAAHAYALISFSGRPSGGFTSRGRPRLYMRIYEQGGSRQQARPYFRAAVGNWEEDSKREIAVALKAAIEAL